MLDGENELLERAQSIVRKALSAISEDLEAEQIEEEEEDEEDEVPQEAVSLDDITMENVEDPHSTTAKKSIIETSVTLTEAVITAVSLSNEPEDETLSTSSEEEPGLMPDQDSGSFISLHSTHSLKIPSAEPLEEEEEDDEGEEEIVEESRAEFVVRKNFENFTAYTQQLNGTDRLTEKRFLQVSLSGWK